MCHQINMNREEAKIIVEKELESNTDFSSTPCAVLDDETIEREWGWVFFYQSQAFIESGDFRDMVGGNAPIIINKNNGLLTYTGTAHDIEHYINEYEQKL
ncbi:YrhB domain-containing protein [Psychrobium sp. nBUS_13]|uniref:YrhB domain-containing protein n=1 Tax=Psychrobium sp. nBUS_13 TaxID=3395319 RepID=UPI003EBC7FC8